LKCSKNAQNILTFRRILHRRAAEVSAISRTDPTSFLIENDPATRSILIENASQQRGFLPYDYRISNTFESIRRHRGYFKDSKSQFPVIAAPSSLRSRSKITLDAFGNSTSSLTRLAEQRLILREKSPQKKHNSTPTNSKHPTPKSQGLSDADFVSDIPNALELLHRNTHKQTHIEQHLTERLKRERLQQARYRLLPINRATND